MLTKSHDTMALITNELKPQSWHYVEQNRQQLA